MKLTKKIGKVFTSKFVGTGPSSYKKRIYRAAVSQRVRNTAVKNGASIHHFNPHEAEHRSSRTIYNRLLQH